ncbi:MAG: T9SS type A sorting domain-containing protein, partial [Bacteroidetes bacterium]|nr:T9SS type A sorting domain-containing protein [Bacteroidota bacterium]
EEDTEGIHFHNALWGSLMSGAAGSAMSWWWDSYIHPQDLYGHFQPVSMVARQIPFKNKKMAPSEAFTEGASGDLILTPTIGWGVIAADSFQISDKGVVTPETAALSSFLYGSDWNTQYRSPPSFYVTYPAAGTFSVTTGNDAGTDPRINIWVDGTPVLNAVGETNKTYSVNISPGAHIIKVDNEGTDWISIVSYTLSGVGYAADVYVVKGEDKKIVAGWVLNSAYNHENVNANETPDPVENLLIHIPDFDNGSYYVKWYDCLTGEILASDPVSVANGELTFSVPDLQWDLAFRVDNEFVAVSLDEELVSQLFSVFPNPVSSGMAVTLVVDGNSDLDRISLWDFSGRIVQVYSDSAFSVENSRIRLKIPSGLASGMYWLKLEARDRVESYPVMIE